MINNNPEGSWLEFLKLLQQFKTKDELDNLLGLFLTIEEKRDIAKRYEIVKYLLEDELTQREISKKLQVSIAKITRGSNGLKIITEKLKNFLVKSMK